MNEIIWSNRLSPGTFFFQNNILQKNLKREGLTDCFFEAFPIPSIQEFPGLLDCQSTIKRIGCYNTL